MIAPELEEYEFKEQLGSPGAYGWAFRAERGGQDFVVKVLPRDGTDALDEQRFAREVTSLQRIDHPLVMRYVDHGVIKRHDGVTYYLVMPYEAGRSLHDLVRIEPRWPEKRVIDLAMHLADALAAIHAEGVVHRDLKPSNLLLRPDGRPLVLDFGIAKLIDYSSITLGTAPGTLRYMAPEQPYDEVDHRADLYSLGVIMYELLTGTPVFDVTSDRLAQLKKIKEDAPDRARFRFAEISAAIDDIVMQLLAKEPYERFPSASALHSALEAAQRHPTRPAARRIDTGLGPQFYVQVQAQEGPVLQHHLARAVSVDGVVYGVSQAGHSSKPIHAARWANRPVAIDPETHRLSRSDFTYTESLRALPYVKQPLMPWHHRDLVSDQRCRSFVRTVLDHEHDLGATIYVAPYFYVSDLETDRPWVMTNARMVIEARRYLRELGEKQPLWAVICTDAEALCREEVQHNLVTLYSTEEVDGFWFLINFDELTVNAVQLTSYLATLLRFRRLRKPVIAGRVGSLGLGMCAVGVTGFSSGMTTQENFAWSYFTQRAQISGGQQRFYVEELLQHVSFDVARTILSSGWEARHRCTCPSCAGKMLDDQLQWQAAREHFLYIRSRQIDYLGAADPSSRVELFREMVRAAQQEASGLTRQGIRIRHEHFARWLLAFDNLVDQGLISAA
jgi:eukaryotic-like serine/threonine-protein kinase